MLLLTFRLPAPQKMDVAVVSTNVVRDQQDMKTSMETKPAMIETNNEMKKYELAKQKILDKV